MCDKKMTEGLVLSFIFDERRLINGTDDDANATALDCFVLK